MVTSTAISQVDNFPLIAPSGGGDPSSHAAQISAVDRAISDMLRDLSEAESKLLISLGKIVHYQPGVTVTRAGDAGGELFLVLSGMLIQSSEKTQKPSEAPALFLRGDVVGEVPFSIAGVRKTSVAAIEPSCLLVLSYCEIDKLVSAEPRLAAKVFRNLARVVATRFLQEIGFTVTQMIPPSAPLLDLESCLSS